MQVKTVKRKFLNKFSAINNVLSKVGPIRCQS